MSKNYYQEKVNSVEDYNNTEILPFWSDEDTYKWIEKEQPNYQLIQAIIDAGLTEKTFDKKKVDKAEDKIAQKEEVIKKLGE